jgi:hypothetical protein
MSYLIASALAAVCAAGLAQADTLSLADIKARNAVALSAEELQQLLPGAKVVSRAPNGSTRVWKNESGGKLVATTDARGATSTGSTRPHSGEGSWRIENNAYCVTIQWLLNQEQWCRRIYTLDGKYYGVPSRADDSARALEFEFSK